MQDMQEQFEENGYYVLRGVLTEQEVDRLSKPIRGGFEAREYDSHRGEGVYPQPGIYSMGPRVLEDNPEIAEVSLAHPKIVAAIEALFGEPATLAQYWSIMRPPGAGVTDEPFVKGSGAHYDYKPWRCVGSYVKWMFAVVPFVDYIESSGPLMVSPGSHRQTTVLPSGGRVHQVDAARVPKGKDVELIDPQLRKGDVVLMHGFTWHEARPNYSNTDRCGLYMKFHAQSSPPACGPTIYPTAVHDALSEEMKHLVPHHRGDGQYAAVRGGPVGGVDEGQALIEDMDGRVLVVQAESESVTWRLPVFEAAEDETAGILDVCNVMGSVLKGAQDTLHLQLPWLSWLQDVTAAGEGDASETRRRVYGHQLMAGAPAVACEHTWLLPDELVEAHERGELEEGEQVLKWLHMWQHEEDADGNTVTRSYGMPTTHVQYFRYNGNGNEPGAYRVGLFDDEGKPRADKAA